MTRKEVLRDLLARVENGKDVWAHHLSGALPHGHTYAIYAAKGSLDAAKALDDAVLPGWMWKIKPHNVWIDEKFGLRRLGHIGHCHDNPARAWLAAILKALIAQEGEE